MKKIIDKVCFLITVFMAMFFLSGCANLDSQLTIDKQGNATLREKTLVSQELLNFADVNLNKRVAQINSSPDYTAERVQENSLVGIVITRKFQNIENNDISFEEFNLDDSVSTNLDSEKFVDVSKSFFITKYSINFNIDLGEDVDYVKTKFSIVIPVDAKDTNATNVNAKQHEYTWDITQPKQNISLTYEILNMTNILLCLIPVCTIFVIVFILLLFRLNRCKSLTKSCPLCGESINADAKKCIYCGELLDRGDNIH